MWLFPALSLVGRLAAHVYYRLSVTGESVARGGPVLLVANHPNSLLDPVLVVAAARRPVRFLAKAPLFSDRKVGWLMRGSGSIPVYRRVDDAAAMGRNTDMFRAVHEALGRGDAVGIFPEGISHGDPSIAPLKTGAARMALGAFALTSQPFPIVPVGLVFRRKDTFRSAAHVIVGTEVAWSDLASRGIGDQDAVVELTGRIDNALRGVTVNLEQWADQPIAECAVRMWEAEFEADGDWVARIARLETTTKLLARVRAERSQAGLALADEVGRHADRLQRLGLRPADLTADLSLMRATRWTLARIWLFGIPAALIAVVGYLSFWVPFQATDRVVRLFRADHTEVSSYKLLVGIVIYTLWVSLVAAVAGLVAGPLVGFALVMLAPAVGIVGLAIRERWRGF
ncbi:MAG: lysophospholipid acyltransferase family protein, partial [Chloroflexi bacterium]|nr:lysophospholipid acyltransferase family protein [Chloroflexota bacterium]